MEYNGELIVKLLTAKNEHKAIRILEEMDEIRDPSFASALFFAYEQFKDTSCSHYFLSSLQKYSSPQVKTKLTEIAINPTTKTSDLFWLIDFFIETSFFNENITNRVIQYLKDDNESGNLFYFDLSSAVKYFNSAGILEKNSKLILNISCNNDLEKDTRRTAFEALIKMNPEKTLQYFYENYKILASSNGEHIFAEVLSGWKGEIVSKLEAKILEEGNDRAKEIIENRKIEKTKKEEAIKKNEVESTAVLYSNSDIVTEIYQIRKSINLNSLADPDFSFSIFPDSGLLLEQVKSAQTRTDLDSFCLTLRSYITLFDEKNISNHGLDYNECSRIIPNTTPEGMKTPINQFQLCLASKSKDTGDRLFGLRDLILITNKIAHPTDQVGLVDALSRLGLIRYYKEEDWSTLHRKILEAYKDSLVKIKEVII